MYGNYEKAFLIWSLWCSNMERTPEQCVSKVLEIIENNYIDETSVDAISSSIITVIRNRNEDAALMKSFLEVDNRYFNKASIIAATQTEVFSNIMELMPYIDKYVSKYGDDETTLYLKLSVYSAHGNYKGNESKVEKLLADFDALKNKSEEKNEPAIL